jgi:DNA modification methylase
VALGHPAIFPSALVTRLIACFTNRRDRVVLDPFAGTGSTVVAAQQLGKMGIGIELSPKFARLAESRCQQRPHVAADDRKDGNVGSSRIIHGDARKLLQYVHAGSVDLVITSPPYWDVLLRKRSADYKDIRNYGDEDADLGKLHDYQRFLDELRAVFEQVFGALRPGAYCCVVVMDLRKKDHFYPLHSDLATFMRDIGYRYDDLIIWDRHHEYNNLRPLGYPAVFRVNKAHEFILIFQKPRAE